MFMQRTARLLGLTPETLHRAQSAGALTASLRAALPPHMAACCWVAGHDGATLDTLVEDGAWATEIRYLQREIIKRINAEHGLGLSRLRVRVTRRRAPEPTPRRPLPPLPASAADCLGMTADGISDDRLAAALRRLAERAKKR